jgi:hypothetical protein
LAAALISNETASTKERLLYIDNLRLLVIVLVISIHLAVTASNRSCHEHLTDRGIQGKIQPPKQVGQNTFG